MSGKRYKREGWSGGQKAVVVILALLALAGIGTGCWFLLRQPTGEEAAASPSPPAQTEQVQPTPTPTPAPTPTPEPTPSPTPTREEQIAAQATRMVGEMTLYEKVCQLIIVSPEDITGVDTVVRAGETTRAALERYPICGILYRKPNMLSKSQLADMLNTTQSYSKIPLIFTCDEEGGRVTRLMSTVGTTWVGPMLDYESQGTSVAYQNAYTIASDLKSCGFNTDLAPVADVLTNPDNTVIGDRAYSRDYKTAAQLVGAAVQGFQDGGVAPVLKHFPGHGGTSSDSHYGAAYVYRTLDQLRQGELLPFRSGMDAGADAVMVGHLMVPDLDDKPAPLSHRIVTELLREEMGFDGIVLTDALQMQALTDYYTGEETAVQAIQAGVDILLCPGDLDGTIDALTQAVKSGTISQQRLDESVTRILTFKMNHQILPLQED